MIKSDFKIEKDLKRFKGILKWFLWNFKGFLGIFLAA